MAVTHEPIRPKPGRRRLASMRWEPAKASIEFGTDVRTLLKKLEQAHQYPDRRKRYSTRQIVDALFDEQYRERTEMLRSQADKLRLQNEVRRRELIPYAEVKEFARAIATGLRPVIMGMAAPDSDKQKAFAFLAELEASTMLGRVKRPSMAKARK